MKLSLFSLAFAAVAIGAGTPSSWHTYRGDRISIRYPPGWTATARPLTAVTSPVQLVAIGSFNFPTNSARPDGLRAQGSASAAIPANGAFIFGWDYGRLPQAELRKSFPPRPQRFRLTGLASSECMGRSYMLLFRAAGRAFQVHVYLGPKATAATRVTVLRILDSFHARPL